MYTVGETSIVSILSEIILNTLSFGYLFFDHTKLNSFIFTSFHLHFFFFFFFFLSIKLDDHSYSLFRCSILYKNCSTDYTNINSSIFFFLFFLFRFFFLLPYLIYCISELLYVLLIENTVEKDHDVNRASLPRSSIEGQFNTRTTKVIKMICP